MILELSDECPVFLAGYSTRLLQRKLVREILQRTSLFYVPAFESSPLMNVLSQKVGTFVLCKCFGVLGYMFRETEVLLSVASVSFSKNAPCLNFSITRILALIVKSRLVSLKNYLFIF